MAVNINSRDVFGNMVDISRLRLQRLGNNVNYDPVLMNDSVHLPLSC